MKSFYSCILISFAVATSCVAQDGPGRIKREIDSIFHSGTDQPSPGAIVGVVKDGKIFHSRAYGMADMEQQVVIDTSSVFDIASVSKQFTGYAVARLIHEKKLSPEDDVRKYIPELPDFGKKITVAHLLHHTSGLRDWPETLLAAGWRIHELCSFEDIMRMVSAQKHLDFDPGADHTYSNTGYNVLALIVERISGVPFITWMQQNIFEPAGMNSSYFLGDHRRVINKLASSYAFENGSWQRRINVLTAYGSSSMYSTLSDLARWAALVLKSCSDHDPVFLSMLQPGNLTTGDSVTYGYGFRWDGTSARRNFLHGGSWAAYRTLVSFYPDENIAIIILRNDNRGGLEAQASAIAGVLAGHEPTIAKTQPSRRVKIKPAVLKGYTGQFEWANRQISIGSEAEHLVLRYPNGTVQHFYAVNDSTFKDSLGATIKFKKSNNGLTDRFFFENSIGQRIIRNTQAPQPLLTYAGRFASDELQTHYDVFVKNDSLFVYHFRRGTFHLTPTAGETDRFASAIGRFQFLRNGAGDISGFSITGGRVRNIRFLKSPKGRSLF